MQSYNKQKCRTDSMKKIVDFFTSYTRVKKSHRANCEFTNGDNTDL